MRPTHPEPFNSIRNPDSLLYPLSADSYSRHVNDPEVLAQTYEGFATRIVWASILHPFDLLATRMMTESAPEVRRGVGGFCGCSLIP